MTKKKSNEPRRSTAPPIPCSLKYPASFLPGGVKTFVHLAWLSSDERARDVARRWRELTPAERDETDLESLCDQAGIRGDSLLGIVLGTAFELGIDIAPVIGGISSMPHVLLGVFHRASQSGPAREQACEALEFIDRRFQADRERRG
jgi:hypothetical protein